MRNGRCHSNRAVQFITGLIIAFAVFAAAQPIAMELGGRTGDPEVVSMITDYLRGFSIGIPAMYMSISLSGLMMLDNDRALGFLTIITTLAADIIFDLLNVTVFTGGLWGMAIASSLSYFAGFLVILTHFRRKNRILHLCLKGLQPASPNAR